MIWTSAGLSVSLGLLVSASVIVASPLIWDHFLHLDASLRQQGIPVLRIIAGTFMLKNLAAVLNTPQLIRLRFDTYTTIYASRKNDDNICVNGLIHYEIFASLFNQADTKCQHDDCH